MPKPSIDSKYNYMLIKIGLNVAYYRKLKGYSQEQLAAKIGISRNTIGNVENSDKFHGVSLNTIFKISEALEVSIKSLFDFRDE